MIAQAGGRDGSSPLDLLDDALAEPDRHDATIPPADQVDRATWGRTPDALAAQERATALLPGGVET